MGHLWFMRMNAPAAPRGVHSHERKMSTAALSAICGLADAVRYMAHDGEAASLRTGLDALADGYATVHELETRSLQLARHCDELVARGADGEQIRAVMRARRALSRELDGLRARLDKIRTTSQ
jgi:chemotaxis regulatin CheY-phosphate phosphatase CheZ